MAMAICRMLRAHALAGQRRAQGRPARSVKGSSRKGMWGTAVTATKKEAVAQIKEENPSLALHVNKLSQYEYVGWQQGTRGLQLVGVYFALWIAVYAVGVLLIELTGLPALLPDVSVRKALNEDFERMQARHYRETVARRHQENLEAHTKGVNFVTEADTPKLVMPHPEEWAAYRAYLAKEEHAAQVVKVEKGIYQTRRDALADGNTGSLLNRLLPGVAFWET